MMWSLTHERVTWEELDSAMENFERATKSTRKLVSGATDADVASLWKVLDGAINDLQKNRMALFFPLCWFDARLEIMRNADFLPQAARYGYPHSYKIARFLHKNPQIVGNIHTESEFDAMAGMIGAVPRPYTSPDAVWRQLHRSPGRSPLILVNRPPTQGEQDERTEEEDHEADEDLD